MFITHGIQLYCRVFAVIWGGVFVEEHPTKMLLSKLKILIFLLLFFVFDEFLCSHMSMSHVLVPYLSDVNYTLYIEKVNSKNRPRIGLVLAYDLFHLIRVNARIAP